VNAERRCPRCHEGVMRTWEELNDEEQEVVRRLPASADFPEATRKATHRWCTRCWQEEKESDQTYLT
jgi:hypothetical protein